MNVHDYQYNPVVISYDVWSEHLLFDVCERYHVLYVKLQLLQILL